MKALSQISIILVIVLIASISCTKTNNPQPTVSAPIITDISISGDGLIYNITVFFNEGIYANNNKTGDITRNNLTLILESSTIFIKSYIVTHSACQKNANIRIVLTSMPKGSEIITIHPTTGNSLYNYNGIAMSILEEVPTALDGTF